MTENQLEEVVTATTPLWNIAVSLEDIHVQLHQVRNMLYVFDEHIDDDLNFMKKSNDGYVQHFLNRYDTIHSLMDVMQLYLNEVLNAMRIQIDAIYEADRKGKAIPKITE